MTDCQQIERLIGRELTLSEMCACGVARLDGHTPEQIAADIRAKDAREGRRAA